jgi:hypothetical protein
MIEMMWGRVGLCPIIWIWPSSGPFGNISLQQIYTEISAFSMIKPQAAAAQRGCALFIFDKRREEKSLGNFSALTSGLQSSIFLCKVLPEFHN